MYCIFNTKYIQKFQKMFNPDKIWFFIEVIIKRLIFRKSICPFCKTAYRRQYRTIDSKYIFLKLIECGQCGLFYRVPTSNQLCSVRFYQKRYKQGYTTDLPNEIQLKKLLAQNFIKTSRDYSRFINLFKDLNIENGSRIIDYGCSWGYGVYQLQKAGYNTTGFEISYTRAAYGNNELNLNIYSQLNDISGLFDIFFSSHVLEHVQDLNQTIEFGMAHLKSEGYFIAITPNGSLAYKNFYPKAYHKSWGKVHPLLLNENFFIKNFINRPCFICGFSSYQKYLGKWDGQTLLIGDLNDFELLIIFKK